MAVATCWLTGLSSARRIRRAWRDSAIEWRVTRSAAPGADTVPASTVPTASTRSARAIVRGGGAGRGGRGGCAAGAGGGRGAGAGGGGGGAAAAPGGGGGGGRGRGRGRPGGAPGRRRSRGATPRGASGRALRPRDPR